MARLKDENDGYNADRARLVADSEAQLARLRDDLAEAIREFEVQLQDYHRLQTADADRSHELKRLIKDRDHLATQLAAQEESYATGTERRGKLMEGVHGEVAEAHRQAQTADMARARVEAEVQRLKRHVQVAREEKKVLADGATQDREQYQSVIATLKKDREEDKVTIRKLQEQLRSIQVAMANAIPRHPQRTSTSTRTSPQTSPKKSRSSASSPQRRQTPAEEIGESPMQSAKLFRLRLSSKYRPDSTSKSSSPVQSSMAPPASRPKPRSTSTGGADVPDGLDFDTSGMFTGDVSVNSDIDL
jgi:chromosome segregation ATPase